MYRFARTPPWLAGHLVALLLVAGMVGLGLWQLDRHDQRRTANERTEARQELPVVPVDELLTARGPGSDPSDATVEAAVHRTVTAQGRYDPDGEVLVRARAFRGSPGYHVVTPLVLEPGTAVLVNRGWVPLDPDTDRLREIAAPPDGIVRVTGLVRASETRGSFGPTDPADGTLAVVSRVDVARLDRQVEPDLLPAFVQLAGQEPPQPTGSPTPVDPPDLGTGNHLSYAVQWFIFASIGAGGWPLLVRASAHRRARANADPAAGARP